jgi:hypothetical protein
MNVGSRTKHGHERKDWSATLATFLNPTGRRQCRPLEGAAPAAVFEVVEKDKLKPLPTYPFVQAT